MTEQTDMTRSLVIISILHTDRMSRNGACRHMPKHNREVLKVVHLYIHGV